MAQATSVRSATPGERSVCAPQQIPGWRLETLIGVGTWSLVYQASPYSRVRSIGDSGDYIVKTVRREFLGNPMVESMLRHEAAIATHVRHPNLVTILDARLDDDPQFLVMPRLDGVTLDLLIREQRISPAYAMWVVRQTAAALSALHDEGWIHSDVKPANIFVATSGHVILLDLGFCRRIPIQVDDDSPRTGTPAYAAPEWFSSTTAPGPASDVYSLGLVLFEMLTGQAPNRLPGTIGSSRVGLHLSNRESRLLKSMVAMDSSQRPVGCELVRELVRLEIEAL